MRVRDDLSTTESPKRLKDSPSLMTVDTDDVRKELRGVDKRPESHATHIQQTVQDFERFERNLNDKTLCRACRSS